MKFHLKREPGKLDLNNLWMHNFSKMKLKFIYSILIIVLFLLQVSPMDAGPPFNTDDPVPVPYKHWELYIASINTFRPHEWSGTAPHIEVNYGFVPHMQIHILLPLNYSFIPHQSLRYGYGDTELGVKYCFIQETAHRPQIGTFPIIEVPTVKSHQFTDGKVKVFIPVWVQKSWKKLTTYGGVGYWFNPGSDTRNSFFSGWEVQYDFSSLVTLGGELYYQTAEMKGTLSTTGFNIGGSINPSERMHVIFSFGHSLIHHNYYSSYLGLLWTLK